MPYQPRWLQVPERLQAADDFALLLLGVSTVLATRQEVQHLERAERLLDARAGRRLGHGDLHLRTLGWLVACGGLVHGPRVDLDHAAELRAQALARRARRDGQRDHHRDAVTCEQPGD